MSPATRIVIVAPEPWGSEPEDEAVVTAIEAALG